MTTDRVLRVVIAGCGGMSGYWMNILKEEPGVEVVGFMDVVPGRAAEVARAHGRRGAECGEDLEAVLARTRPDALFDLSPPKAHRANALTGLVHGCHVLSEKPLADTMEEAAEMVTAARRAGRLFAVMQNRRFDPNIRRLKAFVDSGALGEPFEVHSDFFTALPGGGFRGEMRHVLLEDMAIHTFDAARLLIGGRAGEVSCESWNPPSSWFRGGASAVARFRMGNGVVYTYRGSWVAIGLHTSWQASWRILCAKGTVLWDGEGTITAEVYDRHENGHPRARPIEVPAHDATGKEGGHTGCIREFLRCIRTGGTPETTGADNIHSLAMAHAAIRSSDERRLVVIDEMFTQGEAS